SSRRRHTRLQGDWSSDVCSSDLAVVRPSRETQLVLKVDEVVQGVHFDPRWFTPEDVGHKALGSALSDLAAAGARPRWFLCALGEIGRASCRERVWSWGVAVS